MSINNGGYWSIPRLAKKVLKNRSDRHFIF